MKTISMMMSAFATVAVFGGTVPLVEGGAAKAVVVLPSDASESERFAAAELAKWTHELTGAEIEVKGEGVADNPLTTIRFARTAPEVKYDGFSLAASEREIVIAANAPVGILFGVYYLLNRYGGIYWCHPDSGADFSKRADFAIPAGRLVKTPMAHRQGITSGNGALATPERRERVALWNVRNGFSLGGRRCGSDPAATRPGNFYPNGLMTKLGDVGQGELGGHALGEMVLAAPVDEGELKASVAWVEAHAAELFEHKAQPAHVNAYARWRVLVKHHPDWFGLVDGRRVPTGVNLRERTEIKGKSSMPCLSNPEVRERIYRGFREQQASKTPGIPIECRILCDDQSQWCECDNCMKLLKSKGPCDDKDKASDYWWDFINWLAPKLLEDPLVSVKVYVYRTYQTYPTRVKPVPHERMCVAVCPHGRCYLHALTNAACGANAKYRAMFEKWTQEGMPVDSFEYMCQTPGKCNYAFWERAWVEDLKWYAANGIRHGCGGLVGPWDGLATADNYFRRNAAKARWQIAWLTGHFEWDPDDDFDAVRDRLFSVYYRAAAKPMKEYRARLEAAIYATGQCMCYGNDGTLFSKAVFQPGVLADAKRLLDEARALAKGDAELERRIAADAEWFRTNWESAGISGDAAVAMPRVDAAPTVDGKLDEPFWRAAPVVDDFRKIVFIRDTPTLPETRYAPPTSLRLAYDETNLYLACVCAKADGKVADVPDDGSTFAAMRGSNVSLYFQTAALGGQYYHVVVSHNGKTYSALTTSGKERDLAKPLVFRHAIADAADAWTLEMAIPLAALGGAKAGDVWKIDAARQAAGADGKVIRGYGSLCGYGQHVPEYWKTFSFGAPANPLANGGFKNRVPPPEKKADYDNADLQICSKSQPAGLYPPCPNCRLAADNPTLRRHVDAVRAADAKANAEWDVVSSPEDVARLRDRLRRDFLTAIGGLPARTPLNVRTTGVVPRTGYRVEKLLFEPRPNHFATAHLFLPDGASAARPVPGLLVPCGHAAEGKLYPKYQRLCVLAARAGLAALVCDPLEQGERWQGEGRCTPVGGHVRTGLRAHLLGWNTARFRVWDGLCALDVLTQRPEVDAARLGVAGQSGGGTLSAYLYFLDDRLAAAAPAGFITSMSRLAEHWGPQDCEQLVQGQAALGLNHTALLAARAPAPACLVLAEQDAFPLDGSLDTFAHLRALYRRLGCEGRIEVARAPGLHGYYEPTMRATVDFMRRRLKGECLNNRIFK